jgi:hypothetical protein
MFRRRSGEEKHLEGLCAGVASAAVSVAIGDTVGHTCLTSRTSAAKRTGSSLKSIAKSQGPKAAQKPRHFDIRNQPEVDGRTANGAWVYVYKGHRLLSVAFCTAELSASSPAQRSDRSMPRSLPAGCHDRGLPRSREIGRLRGPWACPPSS